MKKSVEVAGIKPVKKKKSMVPIIVLFLIGFSIMFYPFFSDFYNKIQYKRINYGFDKGVEKLDKREIDRRIQLAKYYNDSIVHPNITDPFTRKNHEKGIKEYARMLQIKESMGYVEIPKIGQSIPIYAGTNEDVLQMGAGHMEFTSLPIGGKGTHCVLTGHTGLPTAKLFTDIRKLEVGDVFFIHNIKEVLAYKVDKIQVVLPTNFEPMKIVPGKDYCTLMTCTPYMVNTHRLLVRGERTDYQRAMKEVKRPVYIYIIIAFALLIAVLLLLIILKRRKKKKEQSL